MNIAVVQLGATASPVAGLLGTLGHDVTEHPSVERFLSSTPDPGPEVVVICSRRCGRALVEAATLLGKDPAVPGLVVVSDRIGGNDARVLVAAGVSGLVVGRDVPRTLAATLAAVGAGQVCVPRRHARHIERPGLSTREKQVIGLVALGFSNNEIAERLFLAESTVKSHLSSAFEKLGVRSRHEAVDVVINPAFGLGRGIMSLGAEPIEPAPSSTVHESTPG